MKCVVMQPTYLPWSGYFNLIAQADVFVFLDDVQYERSSWQNRNRILLHGQVHFLTVPSERNSLDQKINTIQIDDKKNWRQKHDRTLKQAYAKHPYSQDLEAISNIILNPALGQLADLNIQIILTIVDRLGLTSKFVRSSKLGITGQRTERLIKFCQHFNCDEYLSPVGAADYLAEDGHFETAPVRLSFQNFTPSPYPQRKQTDFVSHLSVVDAIANLGWKKTLQYVKFGTVMS